MTSTRNWIRSFSIDAVLFATLALPIFLLVAIEAAHAQAPVNREFVIRNVKISDDTLVIEKGQAFATDGYDVTGIFFGAFGDIGKFTLTIDNVGLE